MTGTLSVVTFQDSVGVNVQFQEAAPKSGFERSPCFEPVAIDDSAGIARLQRFITRLEADSGADTPENLAGALDFARNNVIGLTSHGKPNVIGDGIEDPKDVAPFPKLRSPKQIFVAFSDAPFHADGRNPYDSSLKPAFKPRSIPDILSSLNASHTTVHVSDPSWVDESVAPTGDLKEVDIDDDYWAIHTGGLGEDRAGGYSLIDLDLLVTAEDSGLLDILLDHVVSSGCSAHFPLTGASASTTFDVEVSGKSVPFKEALTPLVF